MIKPLIVCIIDDDAIHKFTVTRIIESRKLAKKTLVFSDGEEAIQFLTDNVSNNENLPDIIFLDVNMPVMDGWQFLEEYLYIKPKIKKNIAIYMVSSLINPVDLERVKNTSEISDYIIKPVMPDTLEKIITELETN